MNLTHASHPIANRRLQVVLIAVVLLTTVTASFNYPGLKSLLLLFGFLAAGMVRVILSTRSSFFTFFLFSFLTLGCWAKLVLHFLLDTQFIEPIGAFDNSPSAWDSVLIALNIAFCTLLGCHALTARLEASTHYQTDIDDRYSLLKPALWAAMLFTALLLALNYKYSILKVGTEPLLQLPSHLYVVVSFMIAWGNFILLATLGYWLVAKNKLSAEVLFYILVIEGAMAAISMGSRAQMILHVAAPFAIYLTQPRNSNWSFSLLQWLRILIVTAALFVISILLVSADRLHSFAQARPVMPEPNKVELSIAPPAVQDTLPSTPAKQTTYTPLVLVLTEPDPVRLVASILTPALPVLQVNSTVITNQRAPTPIPSEQSAALQKARWKGMLLELSKLVVDRWVGLEGVLTVTSESNRGWPLFIQGIKERPDEGTQAIYQRMSNAQYQAFENFTFMTIPGPIAILLYSGSYLALIVGLAFLFFTGFASEFVAKRLVANLFTQGTVGVALAYLLVQTNFPRVQFFFLIELIAFLGGLYILKKLLNMTAFTSPRNATL